MNEGRSTEIIILGTIHSGHFEAKHYTAQAVKDILLALKPDAICVELYSRFFNPDGTLTEEAMSFPSCPEVQAANEAATELGVRQIPFDREGRDELLAETNYFERERKWYAQFQEWSDRLQENAPHSDDCRLVCIWKRLLESQLQLNSLATPDVMNSPAYDGVIYARHSLEYVLAEAMKKDLEMQESAEFLEMDTGMWQERNRIMADNLVRIAADSRGGRLVVVTGAEHRYILRELLSEKPGIVLREYWEVLGDG